LPRYYLHISKKKYKQKNKTIQTQKNKKKKDTAKGWSQGIDSQLRAILCSIGSEGESGLSITINRQSKCVCSANKLKIHNKNDAKKKKWEGVEGR
jgi:hypothetical protein